MGIYLAKITVLGLAGLPADCHGLTRDNCRFTIPFIYPYPERYTDMAMESDTQLTLTDDDNDLVRQPNTGYSTIRFGPGTSENIGELDRLCTFPRSVYGLSVLSMYARPLNQTL